MLSKMPSVFVNHATGVGDHFPGVEGAVQNDVVFVSPATGVGDPFPGA